MRRPIFSAPLVAALIAAAGGAAAEDRVASLAGSEWGFPETGETYVQFRDADVAGFAGCNNFRGTYTFADGKLTFGPLAATRMACPPDVMDAERKVLQILEATKAGEATNKTLTLKDAAGAVLATLNRRDWD
jgi:heat shock protein HslJ